MIGTKVFLSLGSNLGDRNAYLSSALNDIRKSIGSIQSKSPIYETKAWGKTDQEDFLNQVVCIYTQLSAYEVLDRVQQIENKNGRERQEHWGPRTLDIDILFYGDLVISDDRLSIPHPELIKRTFVLVPLADIDPELIHPIENQSIKDILDKHRNYGDAKPYNKA